MIVPIKSFLITCFGLDEVTYLRQYHSQRSGRNLPSVVFLVHQNLGVLPQKFIYSTTANILAAFDTYQLSGMLGEVCATPIERLKRSYAQFKGAAERERGKINAQKRLRKSHHANGREDKPVVRPQERA
jgi:hypothetical protein